MTYVLLLDIIMEIMEHMCPHENMPTDVHRSLVHNRQKVEKTQMSINWWMSKQNVGYPYNGV